jgi:hypothetical protein
MVWFFYVLVIFDACKESLETIFVQGQPIRIFGMLEQNVFSAYFIEKMFLVVFEVWNN